MIPMFYDGWKDVTKLAEDQYRINGCVSNDILEMLIDSTHAMDEVELLICTVNDNINKRLYLHDLEEKIERLQDAIDKLKVDKVIDRHQHYELFAHTEEISDSVERLHDTFDRELTSIAKPIYG